MIHRTFLLLVCSCFLFLVSGCGGDTYNSAKRSYDSGSYVKAAETVERVIEKKPSIKAHLLAYDVYVKTDNKRAAVSHLVGALSLLHENITPDTWQAEYPRLKEQLHEATFIVCPIHNTQWGKRGYKPSNFTFGEYEYNVAMLLATVYAEISPDDGYANLIYALGHHIKGDFGNAYNFYAKYVRYFPDDPWGIKWKGDMMRETADWQINPKYQREDWASAVLPASSKRL